MALWSLVWAVAFMGIMVGFCDAKNTAQCDITGGGWGYLFLLFVAYFFSHQVLQVKENEMWYSRSLMRSDAQSAPLNMFLALREFSEYYPRHYSWSSCNLVDRSRGGQLVLLDLYF